MYFGLPSRARLFVPKPGRISITIVPFAVPLLNINSLPMLNPPAWKNILSPAAVRSDAEVIPRFVIL